MAFVFLLIPFSLSLSSSPLCGRFLALFQKGEEKATELG